MKKSTVGMMMVRKGSMCGNRVQSDPPHLLRRVIAATQRHPTVGHFVSRDRPNHDREDAYNFECFHALARAAAQEARSLQ